MAQKNMSSGDSFGNRDSVDLLKQELARLTQEQSEAIRTATFLGMSPSDAKVYEQRRDQIAGLKGKIAEQLEKPSATLSGTVEKIILPLGPNEPEKAEIAVEQAEDLYKEIRIENTLTDADGEPVQLKPGAEVDIVIQADHEDTIKKSEKSS
jgi:hypothetical protein